MSYRLPSPQEKAHYVRERFDRIATAYDRFNDLITQGQHRRWKSILVKRLGLPPGALGLDLCCGTGDIAAREWRVLGEQGCVIGLDFSRSMLGIAQRRLGAAALPAAASRRLLCGDAMRLPFADGSLAFVSIGFGLRNVVDLEGCLTEIRRVLRPGGMLGSLDVGKVRQPLLRPLAQFYFFWVVPWMGRLLQPGEEMFSYLPESSRAYPDQQELGERLRNIGFTQVEIIEFFFGAAVIHLGRR